MTGCRALILGFFHDKQTGDLMSRVVNDTRDFELLYAHIIPELITNLVTFAGVLAILLAINWKLALITCFPIPLILVSGVIFAKKVRPFFKVSQKCMGELNARLQDNLSGIHEIQSFCQEDYENGRVQEKNFSQVRAMLRALRASAAFHPVWSSFLPPGTGACGVFGGLMAYRNLLFRGGYRGFRAVSVPVLHAGERTCHSAGEPAAVPGGRGAGGADSGLRPRR